MFFSFAGVGGRVQSAQGLCWIVFPMARVGRRATHEQVQNAHLFLLQFHTGSFGDS
jgi:hypothetical protein